MGKTGTWILMLAAGLCWGEPVVELAPYEVEAWHFDGLAMEVPGGVIRLERAEIESSGAESVVEVLERLAGVRFRGTSGNGGEGQPAMRGFGENSGLRVLVLVDGQVYNAPDMRSPDWNALDVGELETVEVLRGGQTVLYGNHAVAGVIKLQTRRPGEELEGRIRVEAGSDGYGTLSAGLGQAISGLGLRISGQLYEEDGYRQNATRSGQSARLSWLGGDEGARWSGTFLASAGEQQLPGGLSYAQFLEDPRQSTNHGYEFTENREWQATLSGQGKTSVLDWQVQGGFLQRERDWTLEAEEAREGTAILGENRHTQGTFSARARRGGEDRFLIFGSDLTRDQIDFEDRLSEKETPVLRAWADLERWTLGSYLFGSVTLGEDWELSGGFRFERADSDNLSVRFKENQLREVLVTNRGTFPNPDYKNPPDPDPEQSFDGTIIKSGWAAEFSTVWKPRRGLHVWGGWDRVYRYPALDEAASYQGYPLSKPLNEELDPETGNNFEAGVKAFGSNWHLGATAFFLRMEDEILYDDVALLNRNAGATTRNGVELDASYRTDRYGLAIHATALKARFRRIEDGLEVPLVPRFEGGLTAWIRPVKPVRIQGGIRAVSSQFQGNDYSNTFPEKVPGYALIDLSLGWDPRSGLSVFVAVDNVFDKHHATSAYNGSWYPGSGRQVRGRVQYSF